MSPHEGLELELMKLGCTGPPLEPRHRPQAGKAGDPRSQNADNLKVVLCFISLTELMRFSVEFCVVKFSSF